jgi:hypothetical protein
MRVLCGEHPAPKSQQIWMADDAFHQPQGKSPPAVGWQNENISQISERRQVRDDAGKTDLLLAVINTERDGFLYRQANGFSRIPLAQ